MKPKLQKGKVTNFQSLNERLLIKKERKISIKMVYVMCYYVNLYPD